MNSSTRSQSSRPQAVPLKDHLRHDCPVEDEESIAKRRKDMFGDCALVEIIHLHDCLRGALKALQQDVIDLSSSLQTTGRMSSDVAELERRVAGRFKVIWSVFRAHSAAEDEFIWPALQNKTGRYLGSPKYDPSSNHEDGRPEEKSQPSLIEQEEYEEDHADEERMFRTMDQMLSKLRDGLVNEKDAGDTEEGSVHHTAQAIHEHTSSLMKHLLAHLEKEETRCMPLVMKHLNREEINDLVGQIMGRRSSETIAEIMSMAVENLEETEREEMVRYMKQAMVGTFFEKWLSMSGWMEEDGRTSSAATIKHIIEDGTEEEEDIKPALKKSRTDQASDLTSSSSSHPVTSQQELERLIRAIASNASLTPKQKNTTIQGLRDSVWKSNMRQTHQAPEPESSGTDRATAIAAFPTAVAARLPPTMRNKRNTPPSSYYKKEPDGSISLVWSRDQAGSTASSPQTVPLFTASELAPTYHDGANGAVLGCPHYARSCKLRHPASGRLYTCRLCCEQERENPLKDQDSPLDRYAVTEVFCMWCSALQPATDRCINPDCESKGTPFGKYHCRLCNLYDDGPNKNIFHCPFCNVCKIGRGLGKDFRHCMRCNACVSLADDDHHCIPQRLQGSCPICHESMFESTKPLRGLKCGHVMHLSCFTMYRRGGAYTCPLCKKSVEDMIEYFSMLDAAVRMQPMPAAYHSTVSNIYCQDCDQNGQVQYHFVGLKCLHCGSYNTRELGRVQDYSSQPANHSSGQTTR